MSVSAVPTFPVYPTAPTGSPAAGSIEASFAVRDDAPPTTRGGKLILVQKGSNRAKVFVWVADPELHKRPARELEALEEALR